MNENKKYPIRKLQHTIRETYEQFFLVLPPSIVRGLGWKKGDDIKIILDNGSIKLQKKGGKEE